MQEIKYLTQDEAGRFFSKISDRRARAMFKFMYDFGLRASEIGKLTAKDLELDRGRLWVRRTKGGVSGEYSLFRDTLRLLKLDLQDRDDDLYPALFVSRHKNPISRRRIDFLLKRYAKKLSFLKTSAMHTH